MVTQQIQQNNELFRSKIYNDIVFVFFNNKENDFLISGSEQNRILSTFLNRLSKDFDIKVVVLHGPTGQFDRDNYFEVFKSWTEIRQYSNTILKICNEFDQILFKLAKADTIFVSALSGRWDLGFFALSLACDYRIATDDFIVQQPNTKLGYILRDSGEFFLSHIIGALKAIEVIASSEDIKAAALLKLKLIDTIVPSGTLITSSLQFAKEINCKYSSELKDQKQYKVENLREYLDFKNRRLFDFITGKSKRDE